MPDRARPRGWRSGSITRMNGGGSRPTLDRVRGNPEYGLISAALSAVGLLLLATSYFAPGFRPGDVVGANIGAGFVFGLASLLIFAGVAVGVVGAWRKRARLGALLALVPLAAAGLILWLGWQQPENYVDPNGFQVRIVNDGPLHVGVAVCNADTPPQCGRTEAVQDLAPGDFAVAEDGSQTAYPWRVTTAEGHVIGCLLLPVDANPGQTLIVKVSSANASLPIALALAGGDPALSLAPFPVSRRAVRSRVEGVGRGGLEARRGPER